MVPRPVRSGGERVEEAGGVVAAQPRGLPCQGTRAAPRPQHRPRPQQERPHPQRRDQGVKEREQRQQQEGHPPKGPQRQRDPQGIELPGIEVCARVGEQVPGPLVAQQVASEAAELVEEGKSRPRSLRKGRRVSGEALGIAQGCPPQAQCPHRGHQEEQTEKDLRPQRRTRNQEARTRRKAHARQRREHAQGDGPPHAATSTAPRGTSSQPGGAGRWVACRTVLPRRACRMTA